MSGFCKCGRPIASFTMPPFMDDPPFEHTYHSDDGDPLFCHTDERTDEVEPA